MHTEERCIRETRAGKFVTLAVVGRNEEKKSEECEVFEGIVREK